MRIVLYTQSDNSKELFDKVIPEHLNKESFSIWDEFISHLNTLKVPCQILLDKDDLDQNLESFLDQYSFHHIICLSEKPSYEIAIDLIKHGSLLARWSDLWNLNWWWNRSLINFERVASEQLSSKSIVISPYSFSTRLNHVIEGSLWKTLFNTQPLMMRFDGRNSFSRTHLELEKFRDIVFRDGQEAPFPIIAQFDYLSEISPYGFKEFLKVFSSFFEKADNIKLFLLSDDSQYAFDKILVPCFDNKDYDLYKMNLHNLEKFFTGDEQDLPASLDSETIQKEVVFEHIKLQQRSYQS